MGLTELVGTVENFTSFSNSLQRAMLWSTGWVLANPESSGSGSEANSSAEYFQVYVQCGRTMSDVFMSSQAVSCDLKSCKNNVIFYTASTCTPSAIKNQTLCALSSEVRSSNFTFQQKDGPIWSMDGQIDERFDPQLFQHSDSSGDDTSIYLLAQQASRFMDDKTCPSSAQFIAPCRSVASSEVDARTEAAVWCEPEIERSIHKWIADGTLSTTTGKSNTGDTVGIIVACVVVVVLVAGFITMHTLRTYRSQQQLGQSGLWNDDIITANRIPREKVRPLQLISRGAFGEVYAGIFNDEQVAVKMLLPSTRRDIKLVNEFLSEARLTACMEHPRIVTFIGIAWDALSDLCVVMEFMDGGDLRTLLSNYEKARHPVGFTREKATIALHVAHALTYLHSLEPPVIHRDLKSRNILLNQMHEAKLTDFGISRERLDRTMTAGVGTSLWMAPEVMTGEKYDDKADMFSFGVVLSELDAHTLPYTQTQQEMQHSHGRQMTDATLLQRVAMGTVSVTFSAAGPQSMVELGNACVSVDPTKRPSAAEALFKILARELA
ncbi:unnamed protein product [Phytophthora lilii]|uniref:Unnamed protein product n=1 Tax=Phytophthora lilii TaxID=2077276 RepID=A0A9W6UAK7_9STRA|nr:unnamed protein product [Phytophthora lilii]